MPANFRPQLEALEDRQLLTAGAALVGLSQDAFGNLVFRGSEHNDRVTLTETGSGSRAVVEVRCVTLDGATGTELGNEVLRVQASSLRGNAATAKARFVFLPGAGDDYLKLQGNAARRFSVLADGGAGNDEIWGGWNADLLRGGAGNDQVFGEAGHDMVLGDAGNDTLAGGTGNDLILGGDGRDAIHGDWGMLNKYSEGLNDRIDAGQDLWNEDVTLDLRCYRGRDEWNPELIPLSGGETDFDRPHDVRAGDPDRAATGLRFTDTFFADVQARKATNRGWFTRGGEEFTYLGL